MTTTAARLERAFSGLTTGNATRHIENLTQELATFAPDKTGDQLAAKANDLLGGAVVQFVAADDTEGGEA